MEVARYCPNPSDSRLNFFGGVGIALLGQVVLAWAYVADVDPIGAVVPYLALTASGILLLSLSVDRVLTSVERVRPVRLFAGVLLAVGMLSWSLVAYAMNPGPRTAFYAVRWVVPAVVIVGAYFYAVRDAESG